MPRDFKVTIPANSQYRHWLPILTFCPVNNMPDFIYVTICTDVSTDLYAVRKKVKKLLSMQKLYMEECAQLVYDEFLEEFPDLTVTVRLAFNRHVVVMG